MTLFNTIMENKYSSISVIGLAKNTGKTTTLNYIIDEAKKNTGLKLGITSTGWDGEAYDTVSGEPKPKIIMPENYIAVTTAECLQRISAGYKILERTGMFTSLGEVVIIEITSAGRIEIAGPLTIYELKKIKEKMIKFGCELLLFDGALNRRSSASCEVCDGVIIATGINAGYNIEDAEKNTAYFIELISLKKFERDLCLSSETENSFFSNLKTNENKPVTKKGVIFEKQFPYGSDWILYLSGALTDEIIEFFINKKYNFDIISDDFTKIFISRQNLIKWKKRGNKIFYRKPSKLIGIKVNPVSPEANKVDPKKFLERMKNICLPYNVYDVILEREKIQNE